MPNIYGPYRNKMKTPAKVTGRICIDLIKANEKEQKRFDSNAYSGSGTTTPNPPVTSDHNILSLTHLDSNPAAVVEGDLILGDKTPEWSRLPIGGVDEVLTSDGTTAAWAAPAAQTNPLLDGATHTDTVAGNVVRGDMIRGNATPKWERAAKGASGKYWRMLDADDCGWDDPDLSPSAVIVTHVVTYPHCKLENLTAIKGSGPWQDESTTTFLQPENCRPVAITVQSLAFAATGDIDITRITADGVNEVDTININVGAFTTTTYYTNHAFVYVDEVEVYNAAGAGVTYWMGYPRRFGFPNYPWNAGTDLFKICKGGIFLSVAAYTVDHTYGIVTLATDFLAAGDDLVAWIRPFK